MENQWTDKTAIITGGAGGLGYALAKRLLSKGVKVALLDHRQKALDRAVADTDENAHPYQVDVTNVGAVKAAVDHFAARTSEIHILVNCAGITGATNLKSHEVDLEDFDNVLAVNVKGCLTTFQAVIPYMLEQNYGRVLHIASIAGKEGNAGMLAYSASKGAVIAMTKVQGKEYAETGILVNALAPAVIRTEIVEKLPDSQVKYMTDKIPMKRCGTLEEFAAMASFIVSEENSFTTGYTYDLTGGRAVY
ncbi:MAG: SDR family NAD(P)-dependent oxidoreductase [Balneolaceae bacterium]